MDNAAVITHFEAYLLTERRVAKNTFFAYKADVDQFNQFLAKENRTFKEVTVRDIKAYLKYLKELSIGARSMSRKLSSLKVLFTYLHERFGFENKLTDIIFPKFKKGLPTFLSEEDIEALLAVADADQSPLGIRNKTMLYLLYVTGMRISELVNLESSSLRFDTGFITVMGKGGKERLVPLPQPMIVMLREYLDEIQPKLIQNRATQLLFSVIYGGVLKSITRQAFWGILKDLWKKTDRKKNISPHKLRHSLATHMLKNGADLRALQLILGHENVTTVAIYTHVETTHARKVYDEKHPRSLDISEGE